MNINSTKAFDSANANDNIRTTNDGSAETQVINAMPRANSQPIPQLAPLYGIAETCGTANLGIMIDAATTSTTTNGTDATIINVTAQPKYSTVGMFHPTHHTPIQHHTATVVPLLYTGKRKLEPPAAQLPAKRATLTNTADPYMSVSPSLTPYQTCPPNSSINEVTLNECHDYLKSDYTGNTIGIVPTPPNFPQPSYPAESSCVNKERAVCDEGSELKNATINIPPNQNFAGLPRNASLSLSSAPDGSVTKSPPSSYASVIAPSVQAITGHGHESTNANPHPIEDQLVRQRREQYHRDRKQNFLTFTKTLMKYLEINENAMYGQAKSIIRDCADKKKQGNLANADLGVNMQFRLRELVGEEHWKKTEESLSQSLMKDYQEKHHLSQEDAGSKAREVARVTAAPLSDLTSLNSQPGVPTGTQLGCTLQ